MPEKTLINILRSIYHHELTKSSRDFVENALSGAKLVESRQNYLVDSVVSNSSVRTTARLIVRNFKNQRDENGKILLAFIIEDMLEMRGDIPNVTDFLKEYLNSLINGTTIDAPKELKEDNVSTPPSMEDDEISNTPQSSSTSAKMPAQEDNEKVNDQKTPAHESIQPPPLSDQPNIKPPEQKPSTNITCRYIFLFDFNLDQEELQCILKQLAYVNANLSSASWSNYYNSVMHSNIEKGIPSINPHNTTITRKETNSSLADLLHYIDRATNPAHIIIVIGSVSGSDTSHTLQKLIKNGYVIHCINLRNDKSAQILLNANAINLNIVEKDKIEEFLKSLSLNHPPKVY